MNIIIGRDEDSGKLAIIKDGKKQLMGSDYSVPTSVSRKHIRLDVSETGIVVLSNLNIKNDVYVNDKCVERKRLKTGDQVVLGNDGYTLSWELLDKIIPKYADLRPLEQVWKYYDENYTKLQIKEKKIGNWGRIPSIFSMTAIASGFILGKTGLLYILLYGFAVALSIAFFLYCNHRASYFIREQKRIREKAEVHYKCPRCGRLFPLQNYRILKQFDKCPKCGVLFRT